MALCKHDVCFPAYWSWLEAGVSSTGGRHSGQGEER